MKNTLVIHPQDESTDFLKDIYHGKGWGVMTNPYCDEYKLKDYIISNDRIVILGHGSSDGLFGGLWMMINSDFVGILKNKECVCVWCNADQFVQNYGLNGFHSGMFISETLEADFYGIPTNESEISQSNHLFANLLNEHIFNDNVLDKMQTQYQDKDNPIISFNRERLYSS